MHELSPHSRTGSIGTHEWTIDFRATRWIVGCLRVQNIDNKTSLTAEPGSFVVGTKAAVVKVSCN